WATASWPTRSRAVPIARPIARPVSPIRRVDTPSPRSSTASSDTATSSASTGASSGSTSAITTTPTTGPASKADACARPRGRAPPGEPRLLQSGDPPALLGLLEGEHAIGLVAQLGATEIGAELDGARSIEGGFHRLDAGL